MRAILPPCGAASQPALPLPLFVFRIGANHPDDTSAMNNLAVVTHLFYRRPDFHFFFLAVTPLLCREIVLDDKRLF
jgi:hypothetical protein